MQIYTMQTATEIYDLFETRRRELGLSQAEIGLRAFGKADNTAFQNLRKGSAPSMDRVAALADALGLECYLGPKRNIPGFSEGDSATDIGRHEAFRAGYLPLPWHENSRRIGSAPVAFSSAWLTDKAVKPDHLRAIIVDVPNLELPFMGELLAVLDTSAKREGPPAIWAAIVDDQVWATQIEFHARATVFPKLRKDGSSAILMDSERTAAPILGRVAWLGLLNQER